MAFFHPFHYKQGNVWPRNYPATTSTGEVKRFRLKQNRKSPIVPCTQFVCADEDNKELYPVIAQGCDEHGNETCVIRYQGEELLLNAARCELAHCNGNFEERKRIVEELIR